VTYTHADTHTDTRWWLFSLLPAQS